MLSIFKDAWFKYVFEREVVNVAPSKVDALVILKWIRYAKLKKYVNTDTVSLMTIRANFTNKCEGLYKASSIAVKRLEKNQNHDRDIPNKVISTSLEEWFITESGNVVLVEPYLDTLATNMEKIAVALKKYKDDKDPDHEYHRMKTIDILSDYHVLMLNIYGLK